MNSKSWFVSGEPFVVLSLRALKLNWFVVQTADIDEKSIRREEPEELVMVLAEAKVGHFLSSGDLNPWFHQEKETKK